MLSKSLSLLLSVAPAAAWPWMPKTPPNAASYLTNLLQRTGMRGNGAPQWPFEISFASALEHLVPTRDRVRYVISLGGHDGKTHDPTYELFARQHYRGVVIEGNEYLRDILYDNLGAVNATGGAQISFGFAQPSTIAAQLLALGAPLEPDALKIDIDSANGLILRALLSAGFRPRVIMVEINPDLPPPIQFECEGPCATSPTMGVGRYGVSAARLAVISRELGYSLLGYELGSREGGRTEHNAWLVRSSLFAATGVAPPTAAEERRAFWAAQSTYASCGWRIRRAGNAQASCNVTARLNMARRRSTKNSAAEWTPRCIHAQHSRGGCPLKALAPYIASASPEDGSGGGGTAQNAAVHAANAWRRWAAASEALAASSRADVLQRLQMNISQDLELSSQGHERRQECARAAKCSVMYDMRCCKLHARGCKGASKFFHMVHDCLMPLLPSLSRAVQAKSERVCVLVDPPAFHHLVMAITGRRVTVLDSNILLDGTAGCRLSNPLLPWKAARADSGKDLQAYVAARRVLLTHIMSAPDSRLAIDLASAPHLRERESMVVCQRLLKSKRSFSADGLAQLNARLVHPHGILPPTASTLARATTGTDHGAWALRLLTGTEPVAVQLRAVAHARVLVAFHGAAVALGIFSGHRGAKRSLMIEITYWFDTPIQGDATIAQSRICNVCGPGQWRSNGPSILRYNSRLQFHLVLVPFREVLLANGIRHPEVTSDVSSWPQHKCEFMTPRATRSCGIKTNAPDPASFFGDANRTADRDRWLDHFAKHLYHVPLGGRRADARIQ